MSRSININITGNASSLIGAANQAKQAVSTVSVGFRSAVSDTSLATGAVDKFDKSLTKTGGTLSRIGNFMSNNRGLVFGAAGLASAIGEAVGMLGMYDDTVMRASEAQEELNRLQAQGVTSGHEYQQAQNEVTKANRFLNIVTRNTALSMMDNIFFATMLISSIQKMNINLTKLTGPFRAVIGLIKGVNTSTTVMTGALASFNVVSAVTPTRMVAISTTAGTIGPATIAASGGVATLTRTLIAFGRVAGVLTLVGAAVGTLAETVMVLNNTQDQRLEKGNSWFDNILKGDWDAAFKSLAKSMGVFKEDLAKQPLFGEWIAGISTMVENLFNLGPLLDDAAKGVKTVGDATKKSVDIYSTIKGILDDTKSAMSDAEIFTQSYIQTQASLGATTEESVHGIDAFGDSLLEAGIRQSVVDIVTQKLTEHFKDSEKQVDSLAASITDLGIKAGDELIHFSQALTSGVKGTETVIPRVTGYIARWKEENKDTIPTLKTLGTDTDHLKWSVLQYGGTLIDSVVAEKLYGDEVNNTNREIDEQAEKLLESQEALAGHVSLVTDNLEVNEMIKTAMDETTQEVIRQSNQLRINQAYWSIVTDEEIKATDEALKHRLALSRQNDMLMENIGWQFELARAKVEGSEAAKQWTRETKLNAFSSIEYRNNLISLNSEILKGVPVQNMLTEEIQAFVEASEQAGDSAIIHARKIEGLRDSHLKFFSLLDAETKKEFGKQWGEMDLGAIPKNLRDEWKEFFEDLRDAAEDGRETSVGLNAVSLALSGVGDSLSENDLEETMEKTMENFEKWAAAMDVEGNQLVQFPGFMDSVTNSTKQYEETIRMLADAQKDLNIDSVEMNNILTQFVKDAGGWNNLTNEQQKAMNALGVTYNEATGEIELTNDATKKYSDELAASTEMIKGVETNISSLWVFSTQVYEDMKNVWKENVNEMIRLSDDTKNDITKVFEEMGKKANSIFVKIANNFERAMKNIVHNAGVAASKVNSELAKIKDKTVTITYKTVGSPNATGGIYSSFAEGGLVSARSGYMNTVSQPTLFLYGDNTSRQETMAFIPHNQPYRDQVMDRLDSMFGRQKGNINIQAGGDDGRTIIINETIILGEERFHFQRKYRAKQGQEVASLVGV